MMPASSSRITAARDRAPARWQHAPGLGRLLVLLLLYFSAHVLVRVFASDSLELDEAEQLLSTRELRAGYGAQPPLYTWMQIAFFRAFGVSVFALALFKNLLLLGTYLFTAAAARRVMSPGAAALAALAMIWIPQISWDSQRDLTHSVIATTLAAATLYVAGGLVERPRPAWYAALGAAIGLGALAKYNYVAFAALLALTVLLVPALRRRVLSPWLLLSVALAAVVVAPHALWLFGNWQLASAGTIEKMATPIGGGWLVARLSGLASAAAAVVAFLTPLWLVLLAFFARAFRTGDASRIAPAPMARRVVVTWLCLFAAMLAAMVLAGGVTHFKDRWLQPYLFAAPALFFACFPALGEGSRARTLWRASVGFALLVLVLLFAKVPYQGMRGTPGDLNEPIGALAAVLRADGFEGGVIVTGERRLAGRLRLHFPRARVLLVEEWRAADETGAVAPSTRQTALLAIVSEGGAAPSDSTPGGLRALLEQLRWPIDAEDIRRVELPYRHGQDRPLRAAFQYVLRR